jgi:hypothetical protein
VTQQNAVTRGRPWLRPALIWLVVVLALIALGRYAESSDAFRPMRGNGKMLPRMPGPAPDLRGLLFLLGVGSFVWYAVVVAFPLMLVGARLIDADRD